jgi:FixJ family two-component response regulator
MDCAAQVVSVDDDQPVKHSVRSLLTPARYQVIADEG